MPLKTGIPVLQGGEDVNKRILRTRVMVIANILFMLKEASADDIARISGYKKSVSNDTLSYLSSGYYGVNFVDGMWKWAAENSPTGVTWLADFIKSKQRALDVAREAKNEAEYKKYVTDDGARGRATPRTRNRYAGDLYDDDPHITDEDKEWMEYWNPKNRMARAMGRRYDD